MNMSHDLVELTETEVNAVAGGVAGIAVVVVAIVVTGLAVGIYNGYKDEEASAKSEARKK